MSTSKGYQHAVTPASEGLLFPDATPALTPSAGNSPRIRRAPQSPASESPNTATLWSASEAARLDASPTEGETMLQDVTAPPRYRMQFGGDSLTQPVTELEVPDSLQGFKDRFQAACLDDRSGVLQYQRHQIEVATLFRTLNATGEKARNLLVQGSTSSGKTFMALEALAPDLSAGREVLFLTPDHPLIDQIARRDVPRCYLPGTVEVEQISGAVSPAKRGAIYSREHSVSVFGTPKGRLIVASPETILNDLDRGVLSLRRFSTIVVDEVHMARGNYAYVPLLQRAQAEEVRMLFLSALPAKNRAEREALMRRVGADEFVRMQTPGNEKVPLAEWVELSASHAPAAEKLFQVNHLIARELYRTLQLSDLGVGRESIPARERLFKKLHQQRAEPREVGAPKKRRESPVQEGLDLKATILRKDGSLELLKDARESDFATDRQKLFRYAETARKELLAELSAMVTRDHTFGIPSSGSLVTFQGRVKSLHALTHTLCGEPVLAQAISLSSEFGYARHLHTTLSTAGRFAFLDFAGRDFADIKFGKSGPQYLKRLYLRREEVRAAFDLMARATPFELLTHANSWGDIEAKLFALPPSPQLPFPRTWSPYVHAERLRRHGLERGPFRDEIRRKLESFRDTGVIPPLALRKLFYDELCFWSLVLSPTADSAQERSVFAWVRRDEEAFGRGKMIVKVALSSTARMRSARILQHTGVEALFIAGQEWMSRKELAANLELFRDPARAPVLVITRVGVQGLSIPGVSLLVAENPPGEDTENQQMQGRPGRRKVMSADHEEKGGVVYIVTSNTQDQYRYWALQATEARRRREGNREGLMQLLDEPTKGAPLLPALP